MKEKTKLLTFAYLLFLLLFALSGAVDGVLSEVAYYGSFIIPAVIALFLNRRDGGGVREYLRLDTDGAKILAVATAPTVALVWVLSYLTSLLIYLTTGATDAVDVGSSFPLAVLSFALVPALLEELLFRYLPMKLIAPHSRRRAVWLSAVFFAMAHMSPFQLVYAFAAGVIFMALDLAAESVLPSVILHFVNNLVSLILIFYPDERVKIAVIVSLCLLFVLSVPVFLRNRRKIAESFVHAFSRGAEDGFDPTPLIFIIPAAVVAASMLF